MRTTARPPCTRLMRTGVRVCKLHKRTTAAGQQLQAQAQASMGSAYMYADGPSTGLPSWAVLGEYDNGSANGTGRTEYIWLPTEDGSAMSVGMLRNSKFFAIHTDHLGTPRLMTDSTNQPVWQWPYSAFGNNQPTGVLKPTPNALERESTSKKSIKLF